MIDYKNTLNLPFTNFPMRGNLIQLETNILNNWNKKNIYIYIRKAKKNKKKFILHDGPPYANGPIHIGHAVNKILKDIIVKYKGLMGYNSPYIPGWDCHGLPIELKVEKSIGKSNKTISSTEFRAECRNYATTQINEQKNNFIRLGVIGDWENPYLTMNFSTEANTIRTLGKIIENGHIYRSIKPVHWCMDCQSSLAEAEVEYHDKSTTSIYVDFTAIHSNEVANKFNIFNIIGEISLIIWTTTPWTLAANRGIAVHPELYYQLIKVKNKYYIVAAHLVNEIMQKIGIISWEIIGKVKGKLLNKLYFYHPFISSYIPIVLSKHVTLNIGTGIVHIAPGHGPEDYIIGLEYDLEIFNAVNPNGCYIPGILPLLDNLNIFQGNDIIVNLLRNNNKLIKIEKILHSYPYCWRHKTSIIFRSTPQWFISMDKNSLREKALKAIKKIKFIPEWGNKHFKIMITNRPDWCISRQRNWGVPITLFINKNTEELHPKTIEFIEIIAKKVEKTGVQAWWDLHPKDIIGEDFSSYYKVLDTLDVWFDSGATYFSVINSHPEFINHSPDMYLEGLDQYRGWFMSSLILSVAITNKAPYKQILSHGFIVDKSGLKMSKSTGNVVSPQKVISKLGADILRLWVANNNYTEEISISDEILQQSVDIYRRIRNTARFLLANLYDFDPNYHLISIKNMLTLDHWAVSRAYTAQKEIKNFYNIYDFHSVINRIIHFCSIEMGSFYLDIIKDRQYTNKAESNTRRSCQTALYHIIEALVRWISPILSFTANEIWNFIPGSRAPYIFTEEWYDGLFALDETHSMNNSYWQIILQLRGEVNKIIEQARRKKIIKSSLEAEIVFYANSEMQSILYKLENEINFVFLSSSISIEEYIHASTDAVLCQKFNKLKISILKAKGQKCPRCWHYEININKNINDCEICHRCFLNINGVGENRKFV